MMISPDSERVSAMQSSVEVILSEMGEDLEREGLRDTPRRVATMFMEMTEGLRSDPPAVVLFDSEGLDQMVTVLDIDYFSLCEHHLAPFYGRVHIGYLPHKKIAGLSKFARVVEYFARRPQIQERMTADIAEYIKKTVDPSGVIVVVEGTHLCMSMRGVKKPNHKTVTSAIRGNVPRDEFFDILKAQGKS